MSEDLLFQLTPIEQVSPRGWPRYIFPFELPDDYDMAEVTRILSAGWEATCARFPVLKAEAVPDAGGAQRNMIKLRLLDDAERLGGAGAGDSSVQTVRAVDLRATFPATFAELAARHFPVAALDPALLTRRYTWPAPGDRLPIVLMQLNFIRGGLLLNWNPYHAVGDGKTFFTWTAVWADECRRAQGLAVPRPSVDLRPAIFADRRFALDPALAPPPPGRAGRLADHPEYARITDPAALAKLVRADGHVGQVFYFSPDALRQLKQDAQPSAAADEHEPRFVSTNDALTALAWRAVMAAQFPPSSRAALRGDEVSVFNMAVDGRLRMRPRIDEGTLGSFVAFIQVQMPLRRIVDGDGAAAVAEMARRIRAQIAAMDAGFGGAFTNDVLAVVNALDDVAAILPTAFLDCPGLGCSQTSWARFELYGLEWGPALGGRIRAIRSPRNGILNGMQIMMPALPDGGREILCGVNEEHLARLLADPHWRKYAEPR